MSTTSTSFGFHLPEPILDLLHRYASIWGPLSESERRQAMEETMHPDATYQDPFTPGVITGYGMITKACEEAQAKTPGMAVRIIGGFGTGKLVCAQWVLDLPDAFAVVEGIEVLVLDEGKIRRAVGYFDRKALEPDELEEVEER